MNRIRDWTILAAVALRAITAQSDVWAQDPQPPAPTVLKIRPAKSPNPALKYRLVPEPKELVPGNAAIFYHRACLMIATAARDNQGEEKANGWLGIASSEFPREDVRSYLERFRFILHEAELGAFREECNWEFDRRKEGYSLLLPEIQEIRRVGRLVALKARVELLDGHPDQAAHWLKVGFAMSRHIGDTPFLIPGLVGDAIAGTLKQPLEDLAQAYEAPNLYWALATRPRPLIDMQRSIEGERYLLERELPELQEVDGPAWTAEKARKFGDELFQKLGSFQGGISMIAPSGGKAGTATPRLEELPSRLALTAIVARVYPESKRALLDQGRTNADIDAMPTLQVALIRTLQEYRGFRDDIFKWAVFPYWQSRNRMDRAWRSQRELKTKLSNPLLTMFTALMPAIESALLANARVERQLDIIQCIEAVRIYAADHDGSLPDSLEAMTETPLPNDPITGKPFDYEKVGDTTAMLSAPYPTGGPKSPGFTIRYELKLVK